MRVAIFSEVYWPMISGVSLTLQRLGEALTGRGHAFRVYSATYPRAAGLADRPEVHRSPSRPLFVSPEVQWAAPDPAAIRTDLARFAPDIVHLATEFPMGYAGLRAASQLGLPIIASAHTDYDRYAARYGLEWVLPAGWVYLRWFYRRASLVLCPSAVYERHLHTRGVPHTGRWTRGVDCSVFAPRHRSSGYRAQLSVGPEVPLVTYVGRLAPEKGIEALLDAWLALGARRGRAHLVFVGTGLMEAAIARRQLPSVHLVGFRTGAALSAAYASADILVFPSSTETFGNVLLEGMASGLACLAIGAGGVMEFAVHGDNAILAAAGNTAALTEGLARLIDDAGLRRRLAGRARETALARRWQPIFDRLLSDYEAVIDQARSAAARGQGELVPSMGRTRAAESFSAATSRWMTESDQSTAGHRERSRGTNSPTMWAMAAPRRS
jgi:glycosyltransferase involved in cell wall biosynthesis